MNRPCKIWCLAKDQKAHIAPVEAAFGNEAAFTYDAVWDPQAMVDAQPDVVLCVNDYPHDLAKCLDAARKAHIPSLVLQDGILEWRCQYENPLFGFGGGAPQHQPVLADKIACLGAASARHIASWGNAEKVEITGMPRLDYLVAKKRQPIARIGKRLLVMTAKNPGFTPAQTEVVLRSLNDLKTRLEQKPGIEVVWRVSKSVAEALGVENQLKQVSSLELSEQLTQVDAAITTPSTAILEAMLVGRPVAALDYHACPRFQLTAWTINGPQQIDPVIDELLSPPAAKLHFQEVCLRDGLECDGSAAERVKVLISKMICAAQGQHNGVLQFPRNLLGREHFLAPAAPASLATLYPAADVFQCRDVETLQVRLARAENENVRLKRENELLRAGGKVSARLSSGLRKLIRM